MLQQTCLLKWDLFSSPDDLPSGERVHFQKLHFVRWLSNTHHFGWAFRGQFDTADNSTPPMFVDNFSPGQFDTLCKTCKNGQFDPKGAQTSSNYHISHNCWQNISNIQNKYIYSIDTYYPIIGSV